VTTSLLRALRDADSHRCAGGSGGRPRSGVGCSPLVATSRPRRVASEFYINAINVMFGRVGLNLRPHLRGGEVASVLGTRRAEASPDGAPKALATRIAFVTAAAGIGPRRRPIERRRRVRDRCRRNLESAELVAKELGGSDRASRSAWTCPRPKRSCTPSTRACSPTVASISW